MVDFSLEFDYYLDCTHDYLYYLFCTSYDFFDHRSIEFDESNFLFIASSLEQFFPRYLFRYLYFNLDSLNTLADLIGFLLIFDPSTFGSYRSIFLGFFSISLFQDHLSPPSLHHRTLRLTLPPRRLDLWKILGEASFRRIEFWSTSRSTWVLGWSLQVYRNEIEETFTGR